LVVSSSFGLSLLSRKKKKVLIFEYRLWRNSSTAEKLLAYLKALLCIGCVMTMPGGRLGMAEASKLLGSYAISSGVINTDVSNNPNAFIC
jgi:hypothetical protein